MTIQQVEGVSIPETELDADGHDPFAAFDEQQGGAGQQDPHPMFAEMRRSTPVERTDAPQGVESPPESEAADQPPPTFNVYGHAEAAQVLRDGARFDSRVHGLVMGPVFGRSILEMDGQEHARHRALVAQAFRPKVLKRWEDELLRPVIDQLVSDLATDGRAELTRDYTFVFPVKVIAGLLGVPLEHWEWFRRRAVELVSLSFDMDRATRAAEALRTYFKQIIDLRREDPRGDLISELVQAEVDGHRLSDEEIYPFLMLLSPAGAETTFRSTGNLLYGLLTHPEQHAALMADRSLMPQAIEEAIRWEPPLTMIPRTAVADTELGGVPVPRDSTMLVWLGSANRDAAIWGPTSEEFDIHRERQQHLSFATGPHMCLGMHLARLEMALAVNTLFDRLPGLRLDPEQADGVFVDGVIFRSPNHLPVTWDH